MRTSRLLTLPLLFLCLAPRAHAFAPETTHAGLTQEILSYYSGYFKHSLSTTDKEFVISGAIQEDEPPDRALNHFYDPVRGIGLHGQRTSIEWLTQTIDNRWSWPNSIAAYAKGDTETAFIGLGHALHLVEDAAVPDHTRNDPHIGDDAAGLNTGASPFEKWVSEHKNRSTLAGFGQSLLDNKFAPVVKSSVGEAIHFLAIYSNGNFFSRDTLPGGFYLSPKISRFDQEYAYGNDVLTGAEVKLLLARSLGSNRRDLKLTDGDNDSVLSGYFDRLSKQAVLVGAGVVDLFFKEAEAARKKYLQDEQLRIEAEERAAAERVEALSAGGVGSRVQYALNDFFNKITTPTKSAVITTAHGIAYTGISSYQEAKNLAGFGAYGVRYLGQVADTAVTEINNQVDTVIREGATFVQQGVAAVASAATQPVVVNAQDAPAAVSVYDSLPAAIEAVPVPAPVSPPLSSIESAAPPAPTPSYRDVGSLPDTSSSGSGDIALNLPPKEPESQANTEESVKTEPDTTPPSAVANLAMATAEVEAITLSWTTQVDAVSCTVGYVKGIPTDLIWDGLAKSTTATVSGLEAETEYTFIVRCVDEAGNISDSSNVVQASTLRRPLLPADHVVISEIFVDMVDADTGEFIELYNPTDAEIDLSNYSLQYLSASAENISEIEKKNFTEGARIAAHGFYLIGAGTYVATVQPDMRWSQALNNTGATLALVASQEKITSFEDSIVLDLIAYGTGEGLYVGRGVAGLPGEGQSLERRVILAGECATSAHENEFLGNSCDTNDTVRDFVIRTVARPQGTSNLPEPRSAPVWDGDISTFATYDPSVLSPQLTPFIHFSWPTAHDALGGEGIRYLLTDVSDVAHPSVILDETNLHSKDKNITEIGRSYDFTLDAIDRDGFGVQVKQALVVPGYFTLKWRKDGENKAANKSDQYAMEFGFEQYPFAPSLPFNGAPYPGWHVLVPYYNHAPERVKVYDSSMNGKIWASFGNQFGIHNDYQACSSYSINQSIVFPDNESRCDRLAGGVKGMAYDWNVLNAHELKKAAVYVWGSSFKTPPAIGTDYLMFDVYASVVGSSEAIRLIATDMTKYYLQE